MSLLHCDGFDNYTDVSLKWTSTVTITSAIQTTGGRDGRGCYLGNAGKITKVFPAADGFKVGFAFKGQTGGSGNIATIASGATDLITIKYNDNHTFSLVRSQDNTVLGTGSATVADYTWCYVELTAKINASIASGDVVLKVNTVTQVTVAAGTQTTWGGATTADTVNIGSISGALNRFDAYVDDVVILSRDESFWGDVVVEGKLVDAQGGYADFDHTGAATNWQAVADANPDGDTSYVSSSTAGQRDSYLFGPILQSVQTVRGVQVSVTAREVGANPIGVTPFIRQGGVNYDGSRVALTGSYATSLARYTLNPATGVAWTATEIAALEAGVKVTA